MSDLNTSHIPEPPKGTKISKRLRTIFLLTVIAAVLLMGYFVNTTSSENGPVSTNSNTVHQSASQSVDSVGMIRQINNQPDNVPGLLNQNQASSNENNVAVLGQSRQNLTQKQSQSNQSLEQAFKSQLQVNLNGGSNSNFTSNTYSQPSNGTMGGESINLNAGAGQDKYNEQNMQGQKTAFLKQVSSQTDSDYLNESVQNARSPYEVQAGSIIPAELVTGINSDLPGQILGIIRKNVYDSQTGNYLLIPQGSKLVGVYDSQVAYGQSRVLIAWSRIIFPNGQSINLEGMPGVDLSGMAGLHDLVDNHYVRIFGSALLISLFGAGGQLSQPQQNTTNGALSTQQIIAASIGQQFSQTGAQLIQKNLNIQPTIKIRPGDLFNVFVTKDMVFPGPYKGD